MTPQQKPEVAAVPRLMELFGLTLADIEDVIMQGLLARTSCSPHHPRTYPGYAQWAETVRALRDKTVPAGWATSNHRNFPLSIHPSGDKTIAVQTGDEDTGMATGRPSNRAAKGASTEDAVAINQRQFDLFEGIPDLSDLGEQAAMMWVLLYHVAPHEIRFELSLPSKMVGGKICMWKERIVFPAISFDSIDIQLSDGDENDNPDIEVPVERRP